MSNTMSNKLDNTIDFYNDYVKNKNYSNDKLQNILSDCLTRYVNILCHKINIKPEPLINCIKEFNKSNKCKKRFDEIKNKIILPKINETNRLLLIKSIYYENKSNS